MRRVIGLTGLGFGACLLALAASLRFYVVPQVARAPIDSSSVSRAVGVFTQRLDIGKLVTGQPNPYDYDLPFSQSRQTSGDADASRQPPASTDNLAVYDTATRVVDEDGSLIQASSARYAFNRVTSQLANCCDANDNGASVNFSGVMPLKYPFFTARVTYSVWDGTLRASAPAVFKSAEQHAGVSTYRFEQDIASTRIPGADITVPGSVMGLPGSGKVTIQTWYQNKSVTWVEPITGQIVDGSSAVTELLRTADGSKELVKVKYEAAGEPAYVAGAAKGIAADAARLNLLRNVLPAGALIAGIALVLIGVVLGWMYRRRERPPAPGC